MRLKTAFILFFAISSVFTARAVFAYDNKTTHPALTNEAIDFYNVFFDKKITPEEKEWLVQGSILEDTPPRWINHFYDPIYKQGWTGEYGSVIVPQELLRAFSDVFLSSEQAVSAINWVHNQKLQTKYNLYQGNRTWEKALYEYVKNKNEKEAFLALGYVLHLAEDMSVPDHTRNDTHPEDSPYENYTKQFTRNNLNVWESFRTQNYQPIILGSIDGYFENLADYSNNYFFSKDTINIPKYDKPKIERDDGIYAYGLDKNGSENILSGVEIKRIKENGEYVDKKFYSLTESQPHKLIFSTYFIRLSREAVLASAGIINLFFKEAEKAEKNPSLLKPPPESQSAIISVVGEGVKVWNLMTSATNWTLNSYLGLGESILNIVWDIENYFSDNGTYVFSRESLVAGIPLALDLNSEIPPPPVQTPENPAAPSAIIIPPTPPENRNPALPAGRPVSIPVTAATPVFSLASAPIIGVGGPVEIPQDEQFPQGEQNPQTPLVLPQEPLLPPLIPSLPPPPPPDTTPPDISFNILECGSSLVTNGCLVAATVLHLNWQSQSADLDFFELTQDGANATTTATSTIITASNNSIANFSVRAKDKTGNWSEPISISVEISARPVVINEVAWGGTPTKSADEWIELYNNSSKDINLSGWVLFSETDAKPYINLSGAIQARGYYLIERTDDNTVSDIPADWIGPFGSGAGMGLNNSGEHLILSFASTTIDETAICDYGHWCGGTIDGRTMERFDSNLPGSDPENWGTNDLFFMNGKGAGPEFFGITGTPKARNSISYRISKDNTVNANLTLKKSRSPYVVNDTFINIDSGAVLTIPAGVVIKFFNNAGMNIFGKIFSQGTESEPVVFTSFYDDSYAGDTNADAGVRSPAPADWTRVAVLSSAAGSVFDHAVFRYGGKYYGGGTYCGILASDSADITVSNSVFEYSRVCGLNLISNGSLISGNVFRNNSADAASSGLFVDSGSPTIQNNRFEGNIYGVRLNDSPALLISNIFSNNITAPIASYGSLGVFERNSGSGNVIDAIVLSGDLTRDGESKILKPNELFYSVNDRGGFSVPGNSTLTVEKGVVFKAQFGGYISIYGNLIIDGNEASDVLFTAAPNVTNLPGFWNGIYVAAGGTLKAKGFTFSYAGGPWTFSQGGLVARQADVELSNVLFEYNYSRGLYLENSVSKIENSVFRNHIDPGYAPAILYSASPIHLKNVTFANNSIGVKADGICPIELAEGLVFESNFVTSSPAGLLGY